MGPELFVADIFQEVDEEVRREQLKKLWERYGNLVVAAAILVVIGVAGWRGYEWYEARKSAAAGAAFDAAAQLVQEGKHAEAEAAFAKVAAEGSAGYRVLARLREAEELAVRDPKAAVAAYDAIATDPAADKTLQETAAVRAALLLADTAPFSEMSLRLEPFAQTGSTFRNTARELLALSAWRSGDAAAAKRWSEAVINDPEAPPGVRARIDVLMALLTDNDKG